MLFTKASPDNYFFQRVQEDGFYLGKSEKTRIKSGKGEILLIHYIDVTYY